MSSGSFEEVLQEHLQYLLFSLLNSFQDTIKTSEKSLGALATRLRPTSGTPSLGIFDGLLNTSGNTSNNFWQSDDGISNVIVSSISLVEATEVMAVSTALATNGISAMIPATTESISLSCYL